MTEADANRLFWLTGICVYEIRNDRKVTLKREFMATKHEETFRLRALTKIIASYQKQESIDTEKDIVGIIPTAEQLYFLCGKGDTHTEDESIIVMGPFFYQKKTEDFHSENLLGWPINMLRNLSLPAIQVLAHELWPNGFFKFDDTPSLEFTSAQLDVLETGKIEYNNFIEFRLLYLVAHGLNDQLATLLEEIPPLELPKHIKSYGLRTKQDFTITHNSLLCRAAISGGLPALYARSICSYYLDLIERAESAHELEAIRKKCAYHYCNKLHEYQQQSYGVLVRKTLSYLQVNLCNAPTLYDIASQLGVSTEHLSRIIKNETGKTFTQILTQARIDEACFYLSYTQTPIWEIASLVGYSCSTVFCQTFKKSKGSTPRCWREQKSYAEISLSSNDFNKATKY